MEWHLLCLLFRFFSIFHICSENFIQTSYLRIRYFLLLLLHILLFFIPPHCMFFHAKTEQFSVGRIMLSAEQNTK